MKQTQLFLKTIMFFHLMLMSAISIEAQQNNDFESIALSIWIPDNIERLTPAAKQNLHNKLAQIATKNGISATSSGSRFVLTANVIVTDKYITSDIPAKYVYTMDVTLYIGDGFEGKSFASYSTTVKGVGSSETKAFNNALQAIRVNNAEYQPFIAQGKQRIVDYFNNKCDLVIKEAQTLVAVQQYKKALWVLSSIPNECTECWSRALDVEKDLFFKKIDEQCKHLLLAANNIWNAGQDYDAALQASYILSGINPTAECFDDAIVLSEKIAVRMNELDRREWDYMNKMVDKEAALQIAVINAYRDVAVAWGENQPQPQIIFKSLW